MSPTGAGLRRLPLAPPAGRPSWTPNGKSILIPSAADIVRVDSQTGRIQKYYGLTLDIQTTQTAVVSPDGKTVVYLGPRFSTGPEDCGEGPCPQYALYTARVPAPHRPRRIVNDTGAAGWSPDGKTLAYVHLDALTLRTVATGEEADDRYEASRRRRRLAPRVAAALSVTPVATGRQTILKIPFMRGLFWSAGRMLRYGISPRKSRKRMSTLCWLGLSAFLKPV